MTWNATWPVGTTSVRANRITGAQNTTYIQTTQRVDHYWNESSDFDGRHRQVSMQSTSANQPLAAPVAGTMWYRIVSGTNPRVEMFYRNTTGADLSGIYQVTPSFKSGTVVVPSGYVNVTDVSANSYGEIIMWTNALGRHSAVTGFFRSSATTVEAWALTNHAQGSDAAVAALKFGNGSEASGFNIRARSDDASAGQTWNYRITYRGI